ncbi:hypothetical protein NKR23_g7140 [Pleurostoma richardsiae]|uniref:Zn(2)-C6 fungal-type domain-containing protein n=1 Tax=Pleurostoma richardsiae TaxID=41990 RepID=A0AA38RTZ4_9PEZI|nr:hypothetical protein NKR23_g7140 [Pleurostoma richardsiae]
MAPEQPDPDRIRRVRTGCWTCRRRGYRCDETKPSCKECIRLSLDCEGYGIRLRWTTSSSPAGPGKGNAPVNRPGRSRRLRRTSPPTSDPNTAASKAVSQDLGGVASLSPLPPGLSHDQSFLIQHFFYTISGLLASTDDRSINVYCGVILPMAFSSPLVLDSVLLLSATHLASRYDQFSPHNAKYKAQVLRALIHRVGAWSEFELTTLTSIILLSINEIFEANSPADWVRHLAAAGKIIGSHMGNLVGRAPDRTVRMILDIFAYHNVLALVSTGQPSLFLDLYYDDKWSSLSGQRTAFLASVDTLLSIAARLSRLTHASDDGLPCTADRLAAADRLRQQLGSWSPPLGIPDDTRHTAEAMRYATMLIYYKTVAFAGEDNAAAISASSRAIVEHIGHVPVRSSATASHVWPLYMAGSVLEDGVSVPEDARQFIQDRFLAMESVRGIRSVGIVRRRLEQAWSTEVVSAKLEPPVILF